MTILSSTFRIKEAGQPGGAHLTPLRRIYVSLMYLLPYWAFIYSEYRYICFRKYIQETTIGTLGGLCGRLYTDQGWRKVQKSEGTSAINLDQVKHLVKALLYQIWKNLGRPCHPSPLSSASPADRNQHHTKHAHNHCCMSRNSMNVCNTGWVKSYPVQSWQGVFSAGWVKIYPVYLGREHSHYPISSSCDLRIEDGGCPGKAQVIPQCSVMDRSK